MKKQKNELPNTLEDELYFLISRASDKVIKATDRFLSGFQVKSHQLTVLLALNDGGTWNQESLARAVGVNRNRMVHIVDDLELNGWVKRHQNPENRREYHLQLTDEGRKTCEHVATLRKEEKPPYIRDISEDELKYLKYVLRHIIGTTVGAAPYWQAVRIKNLETNKVGNQPGNKSAEQVLLRTT